MTTLHAALAAATAQLAPSPTARRDAELLLMHVTQLTRAGLLTHPDRRLTDDQLTAYHATIARRARHEPVQYITGTQEFYGRPFAVSPAVLSPRPETEHLVEAVLALEPRPKTILDIGTGSGILAVTLALEIPAAAITAVDLSPDALVIARQNAETLNAAQQIRFLKSDLFSALEQEQYDCIVSNPPYVASSEPLEPQVRDYEPPAALYAGTDGLAIYRRLIPEAAHHLRMGGHLLLEIGQGQREAIAQLLTESGYKDIRFHPDLQGISRVAQARAPGR
jgi:release factor glutamine methyltransferase